MNDPSSVERSTQSSVFRLPGGESVMVRPISPQDADRLQAYVRNLSAAARRNRFLGAVSELAPTKLDRVTRMNGRGELALIAFAGEGGEMAMIAEAIEAMARESQRCEIALSVTDAWQRKGVGTALMRRMVEVGKAHGLKGLRADVLAVNSAMIGLLREVGADEVPPPDGGVVDVVFRFKETPPSPAATSPVSSPAPVGVSLPERAQSGR